MKILLPGLIMFAAWCVISVRWYVCGIYELCGDEQKAKTEVQTTLPTLADEVLTEPYQAPLAFEWSSAEPITSDEFDAFRDSVKLVFDQSPAAVVEVTGLYDQQELNNSEFENLGLARAENIKQLLLTSGVKRVIRTNSDTEDLNIGLSGNINQAYLFELVPKEKGPATGFIITEARNKLVIHFPSKSAASVSDPQVQRALKKLAGNAKSNSKRLLVVGHTDSFGDALENKKLGLIRATEVKDILLSYGMQEEQVLAESEGEDVPLVNNTTRRGRQQNRRVEIIII